MGPTLQTSAEGEEAVMEWSKTAEDISDAALAAFIKRAEEKLDAPEYPPQKTLADYLADAITNLEQALRQRDEARAEVERLRADAQKMAAILARLNLTPESLVEYVRASGERAAQRDALVAAIQKICRVKAGDCGGLTDAVYSARDLIEALVKAKGGG